MKKKTNQFVWVDQHGDQHRFEEMRTSHLHNCLLMIWNNSGYPPVCGRPFKRYNDVSIWPKKIKEKAISSICNELLLRSDITPRMMADYLFMMAKSKGVKNIFVNKKLEK